MQPATEIPAEPRTVADGEAQTLSSGGPAQATPPPFGFVAVVWVSVFSVILWGMLLLFRDRRPAPPPPDRSEDSDATLDGPRAR